MCVCIYGHLIRFFLFLYLPPEVTRGMRGVQAAFHAPRHFATEEICIDFFLVF